MHILRWKKVFLRKVLSAGVQGPKGPGSTRVLGALWCSLSLINVELSHSRGGGGKGKKKKKKTYFCRKKRTAVFPFKNRTKYGKNVLVGRSDYSHNQLDYNESYTILQTYVVWRFNKNILFYKMKTRSHQWNQLRSRSWRTEWCWAHDWSSSLSILWTVLSEIHWLPSPCKDHLYVDK